MCRSAAWTTPARSLWARADRARLGHVPEQALRDRPARQRHEQVHDGRDRRLVRVDQLGEGERTGVSGSEPLQTPELLPVRRPPLVDLPSLREQARVDPSPGGPRAEVPPFETGSRERRREGVARLPAPVPRRATPGKTVQPATAAAPARRRGDRPCRRRKRPVRGEGQQVGVLPGGLVRVLRPLPEPATCYGRLASGSPYRQARGVRELEHDLAVRLVHIASVSGPEAQPATQTCPAGCAPPPGPGAPGDTGSCHHSPTGRSTAWPVPPSDRASNSRWRWSGSSPDT